MVFGIGFDRALLLILVSDRGNRWQIAKSISDIPSDLIEKIQNEIKNRDSDVSLKDVEFTKAIRDDFGTTSMFKIKFNGVSLRIRISKWYQDVEEIFDLDLGKINYEQLKDIDLFYVGSYFWSNSSLFMGIGPVVVNSGGVGYELYEDVNSKIFVQVTGNRVYDKGIDLNIMFDNIEIDDLTTKRNVNRLVKGKKR